MTTNSTTSEDRLGKLGNHLPDAPAPFGAYVPAVQTGNLLFLSGMLATAGHAATVIGPARVTLPPLDGLDLPQLRTAMLAVDAELTAGGAGGSLAAESMANILAVHLIRHVSAPR